MTDYPRRGIAWTTVALLTLAYILSYVDRSILGLLITPIKADLHVSDEQVGYLIGWAFGLFYATIGLPLGWLADRAKRTRIVAGGVAVWSLATIASGLATSFGRLFGARMAVGVGEATLSPCAMSLIGDSFPPERRGRPIGIYSAALALGAGVASLIGAAVLGLGHHGAGGGGDMVLPLVGAVRPWQFALIVVGLPGLVVAPLFLLLPEPRRHAAAAAPSGVGDALAAMRAHLGALGGVMLLASVMTTIAYSQQFNAPAFARTFGWEAKDYAKVSGAISLIVGPLTAITVGSAIDRWRRAGVSDAAFRVLVIGFVPLLPLSALPLFMPSPALAFVVLAAGSSCLGIVTAAAIIALLDIAPASVRGQIVALYYMALSIAGLGLGPPTVGILSTRVVGEANLRWAIGAIPLIYGIVPLMLLPAIARAYRRRLAEVA